MLDLKDKWVFITGAGSGIGYETCLAFAKSGCHVIASDVVQDNLDAVVAETKKIGVQAIGYILDVSDEQAYQKVADEVIEKYGCPDVLISNAGIAYMCDFQSHDKNMWQRTFDINVMGVVNGTKVFLQAMEASDKPKAIMNVASMASRVPYIYQTAYAASKGAVEKFTDALRTDLKVHNSNVRLSTVHPGVINTNIVPSKGNGFTEKGIKNLQKKYSEHGSHPSVVAEDIVKGVQKDKSEIWSGAKSILGYLGSKLLSKKQVAKMVVDDARKGGIID